MANQYSELSQILPEDAQIRREEIIRLRRRGVLFGEIAKIIAEKFGRPITDSMCAHEFREAMRKRSKELNESLDDVRQTSLDRIDTLLAAIMERAEAGSLDHIEMVIKLEQRRAKLVGSDAPTKHETEDKTPRPKLSEAQILERMAQIQGRLAGRGLLTTGSAAKMSPTNNAENPAPIEGELVGTKQSGVLPEQDVPLPFEEKPEPQD